jgi:hypothetical protein
MNRINRFCARCCAAIITCLIIAPCLLTLNEQPDDVPQKWWVNAAGLAYTLALAWAVKRFFKTKKT